VISGTPRLILTGNEQLLAENHHGIIEYLPTKIAFKTAQGKVEVVGEHLLLASLSSDELIVEGNIMAVRLVAEGTNV
jgi:sporulation protein YqfC